MWFLWCFSQKTGIDFGHFGLETTVLSFQFLVNYKEKVLYKFEIDFKSFRWPSNLRNNYVIYTFVNMYVAFCDLYYSK